MDLPVLTAHQEMDLPVLATHQEMDLPVLTTHQEMYLPVLTTHQEMDSPVVTETPTQRRSECCKQEARVGSLSSSSLLPYVHRDLKHYQGQGNPDGHLDFH